MQTFKYPESTFNKLWPKLVLRTALILAIILGVVLFGQSDWQDSNWIVLLIGLFAGGIGIVSSIRKLRKQIESFTVELTDNSIIRKQVSLPDLTIPFSEITQVIKAPKGNLVIKGRTQHDLIFFLPDLDTDGQIEGRLSSISPITVKTHIPIYKQYASVLATIGVAGLMVIMYGSEDKLVFSIASLILLGALIWSVIYVSQSKIITNKKLIIGSTIWLIIALLVGVYLRLA